MDLSNIPEGTLGKIIRTVAPTIAKGLGGPLGGVAAEIVLDALGVPKDSPPEVVREAANAAAANPDETRARLAEAEERYKTAVVQANADVDKTNVVEVNQTMRQEISQGVSWWHWRHLLGYATLLWAVGPLPVILYYMARGDIPVITAMIAGIAGFTPWFAILAGLNGYVAQDTTNLKTAALTGEQPKSTLQRVTDALGRKK